MHLEPYSKGFHHKGFLYHTVVFALPKDSPKIDIPETCKQVLDDALHANLLIDTLYNSMMTQLKGSNTRVRFQSTICHLQL